MEHPRRHRHRERRGYRFRLAGRPRRPRGAAGPSRCPQIVRPCSNGFIVGTSPVILEGWLTWIPERFHPLLLDSAILFSEWSATLSAKGVILLVQLRLVLDPALNVRWRLVIGT